MDLGAKRAERRGYQFWKALTTGKSTKLGGIPHDTYGMTTNSVHQYGIRLLEELGIREEDCTKVQTGGPDGDLGSNEILISKDKTIGIVDGSGVLYDPNGLDRTELKRLAENRVPICNFHKGKLSEQGFMVLINDLDVTLPDGTKIVSGVGLRDTFHLSKFASADLFVPCGGRPNAVHAGNVKSMFRPDGSAKFKYIVEGANLFFTTDARKVLEAAGVKLFKDASTNKGGVTSSSLEVFASLAMAPEDHNANMCVEIGQEPPQFYQTYAQDILTMVRLNADNEFKIIWGEMKKGKSSMESTDRLSGKINFLTDTIFRDLSTSGDKTLIEKVLKQSIPPSLLNHVGFENIWKNTPRNYLIAMVATNLAAKYVYENGMDASEFKFYNYLKRIASQ
jgi:glutamate dehydrogenase